MAETRVPNPVEGMLIYDPEFPHDRWRVEGVAGDGMITAKRVNPEPRITTNWTPASWGFAWTKGYLAEANQ